MTEAAQQIHVQVQLTVPSGSQLVQGHCLTCEASFGVLQPNTDEKFPLFCPFCATFVRLTRND